MNKQISKTKKQRGQAKAMSTIDLNEGCFVYSNSQWYFKLLLLHLSIQTLCLIVCKAIILLAQILAQSTSRLNLKAKGLFQSRRLVLWEKYKQSEFNQKQCARLFTSIRIFCFVYKTWMSNVWKKSNYDVQLEGIKQNIWATCDIDLQSKEKRFWRAQ